MGRKLYTEAIAKAKTELLSLVFQGFSRELFFFYYYLN